MVFNNLLREKKIFQVGGSNCQQPVGEKAQMETGRHGLMWCGVLKYQCKHLLQIISM